MFPGLGGLFSLVSNVIGIGMGMEGQAQAQKAAQASAQDSMMIGVNRALAQQDQYNLYRTMQNRQSMQNFRQYQAAYAASFGTGTNQAGSGYSFSSAAGGAQAQERGQLTTAQQGLTENVDFASQLLGINKNIDKYQIDLAQQQANLASAQGTMNMGHDISQIGAAFGGLIGGPNASMFGGQGGLSWLSGLGGGIGLGSPADTGAVTGASSLAFGF